jgi:adenylate cyclase class 2
MATIDQELEVKFYITDLKVMQSRLQSLGVEKSQSRTHEINLRFDKPDSELTRSYQVLRLRQDTSARLTYKGPGQTQSGVHIRQEIEFIASDFNAAKAFLEALGFQVQMMYEKYRSVYELEGVHITLDEMPFGSFVELEGPDPKQIYTANQRLGLNWEARILESYISLFESLRTVLKFSFRDLSFDNFKHLPVTPKDLNVLPADI